MLVFCVWDGQAACPALGRQQEPRGRELLARTLRRRPRTRSRDESRAVKRAGDVIVASIHWGSNWGYGFRERSALRARLIDAAAVDVVHGHSSHHPKAIEVYRDRLILYGCGDFLNDYEGIRGYEAFRADLALMYFPTFDPRPGG